MTHIFLLLLLAVALTNCQSCIPQTSTSIVNDALTWGVAPGIANRTSITINGSSLCYPSGIFQVAFSSLFSILKFNLSCYFCKTLVAANISCDQAYNQTAVWLTYYAMSSIFIVESNRTYTSSTSFSRNCQTKYY